jgi:hypothetical protein
VTRPDIRFIETGPEAPAAVISLQGEHLGPEAATLADWFDTVLYAIEGLRSGDFDAPGPETVREIDTAITHLVHRLAPRLEGLAAALIRAHYVAGGSHGQLATTMDVSRSTAQSRAARLPQEPTTWEQWARGK